MISFLLIFFVVSIFYSFSSHVLVILLMIESFVLFVVFLIVLNSYSLLVVVFFLTVSVCAGAYGVSLLVSSSSSKSFMQFYLF